MMMHPTFFFAPLFLVLLFHHDKSATAVEAAAAPTVMASSSSFITTPTTTIVGGDGQRRQRRGGRQCREKTETLLPTTTTSSYSSPSSRIADGDNSRSSFLACYHKSSSFSPSSSSTLLFLSSKNSNDINNNNHNQQDNHEESMTTKRKLGKSSRERRGIYARPSAAIERGSGFFVPGLEGSRIRLLFGILVVVLVVANHCVSFPVSSPFVVVDVPLDGDGGGVSRAAAAGAENAGMVIAEVISAFYGTLLILQGSIDFGVEKSSNSAVLMGSNKGESVETASGGSGKDGHHETKANGKSVEEKTDDDDDRLALVDDAVMQRISRALVAYTPATEVRLVSEEYGMLFSFGITDSDENTFETMTTISEHDSKDQKQIIKLCLDAVSSSRGGSRVALPPNHPSSKLLPTEATRSIIVQKVDNYRDSPTCIVVGSDKLLPSYTKNDLRWLGQLAQYNNLLVAQQQQQQQQQQQHETQKLN